MCSDSQLRWKSSPAETRSSQLCADASFTHLSYLLEEKCLARSRPIGPIKAVLNASLVEDRLQEPSRQACAHKSRVGKVSLQREISPLRAHSLASLHHDSRAVRAWSCSASHRYRCARTTHPFGSIGPINDPRRQLAAVEKTRIGGNRNTPSSKKSFGCSEVGGARQVRVDSRTDELK